MSLDPLISVRIEPAFGAPKVRGLAPVEAAGWLAAGTLTLVDVRPPGERALAIVNAPFATLDNDGLATLEALPKVTALGFLCHHGMRSQQAAEHFRQLGFSELYNIQGGIDAWADVDPGVPRY